MALIKCPECGKKVSTESAHCRNCGYPMPKIENKQIEPDTINETTFMGKQSSEQSQIIKIIKCKNFGAEFTEGARFCPECGTQTSPDRKFCSNCGKKLISPSIETPQSDAQDKDYETYVGFNLLSLLVPVVGLILSITFRNTRPAQASCCRSNMILGFIFNGIFALFVTLFFL